MKHFQQRTNLTALKSSASVSSANNMTWLFQVLTLVFCLGPGRLRNLQVANYMQLYENGTCEIHLTCSVENPNDHVSFRWHVSGNILLEEANFTIFWDPKTSSEQTYYCIAENPVSNLSFSFSVQSPCKGVFNEKNQHLKIIWITVTIVFSLIAIAVCLFVSRKKLAGFLSFYLSLLQGFRDLESGASG